MIIAANKSKSQSEIRLLHHLQRLHGAIARARTANKFCSRYVAPETPGPVVAGDCTVLREHRRRPQQASREPGALRGQHGPVRRRRVGPDHRRRCYALVVRVRALHRRRRSFRQRPLSLVGVLVAAQCLRAEELAAAVVAREGPRRRGWVAAALARSRQRRRIGGHAQGEVQGDAASTVVGIVEGRGGLIVLDGEVGGYLAADVRLVFEERLGVAPGRAP